MEKWRPDSAYGPSSLHTTAIDFARFIATLLVPGEVLNAASTAEMLTPQCEVHEVWGGGPPAPGSSWGIGWGLQTIGRRSAWHWGWNDGFLSFAVAWPEESRAVVSFTNGMNGLWVCKELVTEVSGEEHPGFRWLEH